MASSVDINFYAKMPKFVSRALVNYCPNHIKLSVFYKILRRGKVYGSETQLPIAETWNIPRTILLRENGTENWEHFFFLNTKHIFEQGAFCLQVGRNGHVHHVYNVVVWSLSLCKTNMV